MSKNPFQPVTIGGIQLKNRFIRSATFESVAEKGKISHPYLQMHEALAKGGVGLIITGYLSFSKMDHSPGTAVSIDSDSCIPSLQELTDMAHDHNCKIMAQLNHAGSQLFSKPQGPVYCASDVVDPVNGIKPTPFSKEQIQVFIEEFAQASLRMKKAGFDGVQIHGSHGYLLSKFLSPHYNKRKDEYGGDIRNRCKIIVEILNSIKDTCGSQFPVWIKLNCSDFGHHTSGLTEDDFRVVARELAENGIDAIEVSGGTVTGKHQPSRSIKHEAYHLEYAERVAKEIEIPVIPVGGFRRIESIEQALINTSIAAVSLSRSLIREPGLIKRWQEGNRNNATCIACSGCYNPEGTTCFQDLTGERKERQKAVNKHMRSLVSKE